MLSDPVAEAFGLIHRHPSDENFFRVCLWKNSWASERRVLAACIKTSGELFNSFLSVVKNCCSLLYNDTFTSRKECDCFLCNVYYTSHITIFRLNWAIIIVQKLPLPSNSLHLTTNGEGSLRINLPTFLVLNRFFWLVYLNCCNYPHFTCFKPC